MTRELRKEFGHRPHFRSRRIGRRLRRELEEVLEVLDKLRRDVDEATVILVEGFRDRQALKQLDIQGRILSLQEFRREVITLRNAERIILLPDFDQEGREILERIRQRLEEQGFKADTFYYRQLSKIKRFGVYTVEEMGRYLRRAMQ